MSKVFSVIGGDQRNAYLASLLKEDNFDVKVYGLHSDIPESKNLEDALINSDFVIGPVPYFKEEFYESTNCNIEELFDKLKNKSIFIAGKIDDEMRILGKDKRIHLIDLFELEEFAIQNSIPTAEGAIQIAMRELPTTIHASNVLVSGFGRVGKMLAKMLTGLGAKVTTVSRSYEQIAISRSLGYNALHFRELPPVLQKMDIIFNTVPQLVFHNILIDKLNKQCLIIDVSSKPHGIDFDCCEKKEIKAITCRGIPGKTSPKTSAMYIKENIINALLDLGENL